MVKFRNKNVAKTYKQYNFIKFKTCQPINILFNDAVIDGKTIKKKPTRE